MWNISNGLSLLRLFLTLPIVIAIWNGYNYLALILGVFAMITDYLDGYFARRLNQVTEYGKILDPLADKVIIISVVILLTYMNFIPIWLASMVFIRDILIFLGGIFLKSKLGYILPSNQLGKWTVTFLAVYIVYIILEFEFYIIYFEILIGLLLVLSFIVYLLRAIKTLKKHSKINKTIYT